MVAPTSMPIDPALLAEERSPQEGLAAGAKRKSRSINVSSSPISPAQRFTRRSTRNAPVINEPSRGEEDNLNKYDAGVKRSREDSSSPEPSLKRHESRIQARQGESSKSVDKLPARTMPYPYGLTPFPYPCHNPHVPPPPPGNPSDPNFHPFDPTASSSALESKNVRTRGPESEPPTEINTPMTASGSNADVSQYLTNTDYPPLDTSDAAFQSLSALLAASQEFDPNTPNHLQQTHR